MKPHSLKQALKHRLSAKEHALLRRSFDLIGDIAVLEMPRELQKKEGIIAQALLNQHKHIKTVVKKVGGHTGRFRIQHFKILAGERKKITEYRENKSRMKLHLEMTYFSPRLAHERLRIAQLIKKPEEVLVMFSGIAPYCLAISRNSPARRIYGVELNKEAHQFGLENISLNKIQNIKLFHGDV